MTLFEGIDRRERHSFRTIEVRVDLFGLLGGVELAEQFQTYDIDSDLVFSGD